MDISVLSSTFLLTLLLSVGLFFFIRASVKDRTQVIRLKFNQPKKSTFDQLCKYFTQRAYQVVSVDEAENQMILEGLVRPSVFLAIFLTLLTAVGLVCLGLVFSTLLPMFAGVSPGLILLAPVAGFFYWQKAGRFEKVLLRFDSPEGVLEIPSFVTITAHRDELQALQSAMSMSSVE